MKSSRERAEWQNSPFFTIIFLLFIESYTKGLFSTVPVKEISSILLNNVQIQWRVDLNVDWMTF